MKTGLIDGGLKVKVLVVTGYGINCEDETAAAFRQQGAISEIIHINTLLNTPVMVHSYSIFVIPGGFSFGDDIFSGKVFANKIMYKKNEKGETLFSELKKFISEGKYVLGICNGFQVLTRLGLLPNVGGNYQQEVTLAHNSGGSFIDKWVKTRVTSSLAPFWNLALTELPIRHGEGRVIFKNDEIRTKVSELQLNWLTYTGNPNGSEIDCAGLCDVTGRVIGLMPHPEAFTEIYNHPAWSVKLARKELTDTSGEGSALFRNLIVLSSEELQKDK